MYEFIIFQICATCHIPFIIIYLITLIVECLVSSSNQEALHCAIFLIHQLVQLVPSMCRYSLIALLEHYQCIHSVFPWLSPDLNLCLSFKMWDQFSHIFKTMVVGCIHYRIHLFHVLILTVCSVLNICVYISTYAYIHTLVRTFAMHVSAYPRLYFSVMRTINIVSAAWF